jgi:hypothetical protein
LFQAGVRGSYNEALKERGYLPMAEDPFVRNYLESVHKVGYFVDRLYLYNEPVGEMRRRLVPVRPNREVRRKEYLKKPHFHHNHKSNC